MSKVSVIIPSRNCEYLAATVNDAFDKATGNIEVIVLLDGWKPDRPLKYHKNLEVIYREEPGGLRHGINNLVAIAGGEFVFKADDHCMFGVGYDEILKRDMKENWLVTPSRLRLDAKSWTASGEPIEYLYLTFPYKADDLYGSGFHGKKWIGSDGIGENMGKTQYYYRERERRGIKIDDIQIMQGSGWFTTAEHFRAIGSLDEVHSHFYQEANELCFKTWLSGGRVVVNKNTWYAHWHKSEPPTYGMTKAQKRETERFSTWVWMNDKWPAAKRTMAWFVDEKFAPMPGWPADWKSYVKDDNGFRVFDENGNDGFKIS